MNFQWTPAHVETLLAMIAAGKPFRVIAAHFGVSRNAVIGKWHRVRDRHGIQYVKPSGPRHERMPAKKKPTMPKNAGGAMLPPIPSIPVLVPDQGQLASIVDVTGCKWPVKEDPAFIGGYGFCNHATDEGRSYCPYHEKVKVPATGGKPVPKSLGAYGLRFEKRSAA